MADFLDVQNSSGEQLAVSGIASVTSLHTTTAITVNEYETRLVQDLRLWLQRKAPESDMYMHNDLDVRELPGVGPPVAVALRAKHLREARNP